MTSPPLSSLAPEVGFELLKLMLQVAWSDHELNEAERGFLRGLCGQLGLGEAMQEDLEGWLSGAPLPPPDLQLLRRHSELAMRTAAGLMVADGNVLDEERDVLQEMAALLTGTW